MRTLRRGDDDVQKKRCLPQVVRQRRQSVIRMAKFATRPATSFPAKRVRSQLFILTSFGITAPALTQEKLTKLLVTVRAAKSKKKKGRIELWGSSSPFRLTPSRKSSEGRNFLAQENMRAAMPALSRQLFLFVKRFCARAHTGPIARTDCTRIAGLCAWIAHG